MRWVVRIVGVLAFLALGLWAGLQWLRAADAEQRAAHQSAYGRLIEAAASEACVPRAAVEAAADGLAIEEETPPLAAASRTAAAEEVAAVIRVWSSRLCPWRRMPGACLPSMPRAAGGHDCATGRRAAWAAPMGAVPAARGAAGGRPRGAAWGR